MPGEWYGGQLHFDPLAADNDKAFQISTQIGLDLHEINIRHESVGG